ncbi:MAG: HupE/UreJ family protein [Lacunisphaera sp.]|nr:HupE/UreJ family protein [Lacunisphaera sp.]
MNWICSVKQGILALILVYATAVAWAHDPGLSTATVRLFPDKLEAILTFALKDANELAGLDTNNDGQVSVEEFAAAQERLGETVAKAFEVRFDDTLAKATDVRCQLDQNSNVDVYLSVAGRKFSKLAVRSKMIAGFRIDHRQYIMLQNPSGVTMVERLLSANSDTVEIQFAAESPAATTPVAPAAETPPPAPAKGADLTFRSFVLLGVEHIGTGYDHLLFLFALLVVTRSFRSALVVITAFTLAHSITLAIATFNLVQLPAKYNEPLIAATIVYVGVENLAWRGDPHGRWMLTFAFGLIHGFGFASVLRDMGVGAHAGGVAMPLFSFNLGVELGQIAVAAIMLPIIWQLRKREFFVQRGVPACSVIVALVGTYWFVQRVWPN